ncbi:chromate resistance protein ChrB [Marinobacter halodurans]|uniref:Chromate resistance protein ChrB n=1 Tax=Marinobacter halodurans TaxID=2528979 RepID=A0ABY1ZLL3_9GAMM|nr:chromate resistance protein ChrB [Marinobacter halodurans]
MTTEKWLTLIYKIPPEPSSKRVALWRKLKGLGAIYLQNGVCLLPRTDRLIRQAKLIENDIIGMQGEIVVLDSVGLDQAQEERVLARFNDERNDQYREFIGQCEAYEAEIAKEFAKNKFTYAELEEEEAELQKLQRWLDKIRALDFYTAPLAEEAGAWLSRCEALLDGYAHRVFAEQNPDS